MRLTKLAFFAAAALIGAGPALAQKSQDTLRLAVISPFAALSTYDLPHEEAAVFSREIYDFLMVYDEHNKKFVPSLAKSWKRIDDKTLEFELQDGVKFHNGNVFNADDVVYTVKFVIDPENKLRQQESAFLFVKDVEKLSSHRVRLTLTRPEPVAEFLLAARFLVWPGKHTAAQGHMSHATKPIGTGPYRFVEFKRNETIRLERNPNYWKAGLPYLDAIEYTIVPNRSTAAATIGSRWPSPPWPRVPSGA